VLVLTLAMAAVGFALLVVALMTGSVAWAWGCIVVCVIGAVLLLVSSLRGPAPAASDRPASRGRVEPDPDDPPTERFDRPE
jgi:hypothetical protein